MSGGTSEILRLDYVEDQDASVAYTSPEVSLSHPLDGIYYQMAWSDGVFGDFIFEVTIFPDKWESLKDCGEVKIKVDTGLEGHEILCIPQAWYLVSKMRFRFVPESGSAGTFDVALRIIPK